MPFSRHVSMYIVLIGNAVNFIEINARADGQWFRRNVCEKKKN